MVAPVDRSAPEAAGTRANTARLLSAALVEAAAAFAPGGCLPGSACWMCLPLAVLWSRAHKFDAADGGWPDRDRFILSQETGAPLLLGLLHLTGHDGITPTLARNTLLPDPTLDPALDGSAAPGGHAIAMAVGMALAERVLAARFGKSLVDHRVWTVCEAEELTQGITHEAAALAGHYRLDRLALLVNAGHAAEDARPRYLAHGWAVKSVAAEEPDEIESALSFAQRSRKPTLLWCVQPAEPGPPPPRHNANAAQAWRRVGARGALARRSWLKRMTRHAQRAEFERVHAGRLPDRLPDAFSSDTEPGLGGSMTDLLVLLDRVGRVAPELLRGQLHPPTAGCAPVQPGHYGGRTILFGRRPLGAAACVNGIAMHGGTLPIAIGSLIDLAEQLPALRLAARLGRRLLHLAPAHATAPGPAELLGWLRAIPGLFVFQPWGGAETAACLELAARATGPSVLILGDGQTMAAAAVPACTRGGYVLAEAPYARQATLIAAGPMIDVALGVRAALADAGIAAAVVSLPCWNLFAGQDDAYRAAVLGAAPRFAIEGGCRGGWDQWLNDQGAFIGLDEPQGLDDPQAVSRLVRRRLLPQG